MVEKGKEYVMAARLIGLGPLAIVWRHVLPNVMGPVLVIATINLAFAIISEATLSFLGVGVPVTQPSLGMLIRNGNDYLFSGEWWLVVFPSLALVILALSVNLLGDWLRTRHLTQPLESIDKDQATPRLKFSGRTLSVLGVSHCGEMIGSIQVEALGDNDWQGQICPLSDDQVIEGEASLLALITRLAKRHWLFVRQVGRIDGFVSRSDLQRPPFRMLLFGLISLFEMRLLHLVQRHYSETKIEEVLNASRLQKARRLHNDRKTRGEELHLTDCLQIADKRDLLLAVPDCATLLGFDSNNKATRFFGKVEALRDRLVHANDLVAGSSWEEVLQVTLELAEFLERTGSVPAEDGSKPG